LSAGSVMGGSIAKAGLEPPGFTRAPREAG
jgi:hypothetical protein